MFELAREVQLPSYGGKGRLYRHPSGMEVFHIANDSSELTCNFMFSTPSEDDTGVAHILEHTVLCGSSKYPVKDPFSQICQSSPNTFLNAMTFPDKTCYPVSSPLEKDFRILFRIYADAVFSPLLRKQSFLQEGVRCTKNGFDGVVFNEMSDFASEDGRTQFAIAKALYDGTCIEKESGGNPQVMAKLTYEEYKARYSKWYGPANCRLFLYGDLDAKEYMDWIEENYLDRADFGTRFETKASDFDNASCLPSLNVKCSTKDARGVLLTWLTKPSSDVLEVLTLTVLVSILLGNAGSPLYRAITESGLGEDLNPFSGMEADYPVMPFSVGFCQAKKGREKEIGSFIVSTLERLVREGIDPDCIASAMKRQEFSLREIKGSNGDSTPGVMASLRASRTWLRGGRPEDGIMYMETFLKLKDLVASNPRYFEDWIQANLLDNPRRSLVSVTYDKDFDSKHKAFLKGIHHFTSQDESDIRLFEQFAATDDSPQAMATLGRITVADLPERIPEYKTTQTKLDCGATLVEMPQETGGIAYVNAGFDITGLDESQRKLLPLLLRFLTMCGADGMDYTKVGNSIQFLTGGISYNMSCGMAYDGSYVSMATVTTRMLVEDAKQAMELLGRIILKADFTDTERIRASLTDILTDFESEYLDAAHLYANMAALAAFNRSSYETELFSGTASWLGLDAMGREAGKGFCTIAARLEQLRDAIFRSGGLRLQLSSREEDIATVREACVSFIGKLPEGSAGEGPGSGFVPAGNVLPPVKLMTVSSGPAYNSVAFSIGNLDDVQAVRAMLYGNMISSGSLLETIRGKTGAYAAAAMADTSERLFMACSYRDPCISTTFANFKEVFSLPVRADQVEYAKVTMVGKELRPRSPRSKASEAFRRGCYGFTDQLYLKRRKAILSAEVGDIEQVRLLIAADMEKWCSRVSVCSASAANGAERPEECEIMELPI